MKKIIVEFGDFIKRGNVVDMAVGVIIGGAFGKIVSSLVGDLIMPAISMITGKVNIASLSVTLPAQTADGSPIVLAYGAFLQSIIDFLIIALCIFFMVKLLSRLRRKEKEEAAEEPPVPSKEEILLTEIRDLLAARAATEDAKEEFKAE